MAPFFFFIVHVPRLRAPKVPSVNGDFDPTDLRGQEQAKADADVAARHDAELELGDLKFVLSNKRGRRFVHRLLMRSGVWRLSFDQNALRMAFNEGTRNEGLRLIAQITGDCPERYLEMMQEAKKP